MRLKNPTQLEDELAIQIKACELPEPQRGYTDDAIRGNPSKLYPRGKLMPFDFAWPERYRCSQCRKRMLDDAYWCECGVGVEIEPNPPVLVEVQGGTWVKSGHTTGQGIERDCRKNNLAQLEGYIVLHVTKEHIREGKALAWIRRALEVDD